MSAPTVRVLPPDVFDALELSALAFGGVGAGHWSEHKRELGEWWPHCVIGHAQYVAAPTSQRNDVERALNAVGVAEEVSDIAVGGVGFVIAPRVPFAEWCRRLNVVRGDEPTFDPANFPTKRSSPLSRRSRGTAKTTVAKAKGGKRNG